MKNILILCFLAITVNCFGQLQPLPIDFNKAMDSFPTHSNAAFNIQPYFGGQATAPHDITIRKQDELN